TDSATFQMHQHPAFAQAVKRAANLMCMEAIKAGKLRFVAPQTTQPTSSSTRYVPRMDLVDDPSSSTLVAVFEIPGISRNDISLNIRDGHLVIVGQRRSPHAMQSDGLPQNPVAAADSMASGETGHDVPPAPVLFPIQELRFGTFHRAIHVPHGIKESDVNASLHEGMLTVTWPRSPG
ncbi:hypothetical protein B0H34DRAFT_633594, partial [Crassisporium funariophilum]